MTFSNLQRNNVVPLHQVDGDQGSPWRTRQVPPGRVVALLRRHNEMIYHSLQRFLAGCDSAGDALNKFMCECTVAGCGDMLELTLTEYERVRSEPAWFVVRPQHEVVRGEQPVEKHVRFWIV